MKTFYFLALTFLIFHVTPHHAATAAHVLPFDPCLSFSSRGVGADQQLLTLPEDCPAETINNASELQIVKGLYGQYFLEAYGYKKMIFFQRSGIASTPDQELVTEGQISGDQTLFGEISELTLSEDGLYFYVLSRLEGGVYTFEIGQGGNMAPLRYFIHPDLKNSHHLNWDKNKKLLTVDSLENGEKIYLNPLADHRGRLKIHHQIIIDDLESKL